MRDVRLALGRRGGDLGRDDPLEARSDVGERQRVAFGRHAPTGAMRAPASGPGVWSYTCSTTISQATTPGGIIRRITSSAVPSAWWRISTQPAQNASKWMRSAAVAGSI